MGTRKMPVVADFLDIQPVTPELVRKLGYLPQCTFWDGLDSKPNRPRGGCWKPPEWTIEDDYRCDEHKRHIELWWEKQIEEWVARPAEAQNSDLDLLEMIRDELKPPELGNRYPGFVVGQVIKELSLPNTPEGRDLAAWYLWEMGVFSISDRVG
ncbi:MAG: hypothetical protein WD159_01380, partial [Patescibacteria group bacterium]